MAISWLIMLIVLFFMLRLLRHRGPRRLHGPRHARRARDLSRGDDRRYVAPPKVETPMETLQRKYVDGEITVEHYEREVDRLLREK